MAKGPQSAGRFRPRGPRLRILRPKRNARLESSQGDRNEVSVAQLHIARQEVSDHEGSVDNAQKTIEQVVFTSLLLVIGAVTVTASLIFTFMER